MIKSAMFTGTFDPITIGHMDIIERACKMVDKLCVVILKNPDKKTTFSVEERIKMIENATCNLDNVEVFAYDGLAIDFAKVNNVDFIFRGIRNTVDLVYEIEMRDWNFANGNIETLFLSAVKELKSVSSTSAKILAKNDNFSMVSKENIGFIKNFFEVKNGRN